MGFDDVHGTANISVGQATLRHDLQADDIYPRFAITNTCAWAGSWSAV